MHVDKYNTEKMYTEILREKP